MPVLHRRCRRALLVGRQLLADLARRRGAGRARRRHDVRDHHLGHRPVGRVVLVFAPWSSAKGWRPWRRRARAWPLVGPRRRILGGMAWGVAERRPGGRGQGARVDRHPRHPGSRSAWRRCSPVASTSARSHQADRPQRNTKVRASPACRRRGGRLSFGGILLPRPASAATRTRSAPTRRPPAAPASTSTRHLVQGVRARRHACRPRRSCRSPISARRRSPGRR